MSIYSFLAPLLAGYFTGESVLLSYGIVFIASLIFYPMGAIYYGFLGDSKGRQKTCSYSALGLALATGLMGIVPFHYLIFFIAIGMQNFFSGGEYHGSIVFSLEHEDTTKSATTSGFSCLFAVLGLLFANLLATFAIISKSVILVRFSFLLGALGGFVSYLLKNHCHETPLFKKVEREHFVFSLKNEGQNIFRVISVLAFFIVSYSYIFIVLPLILPGPSFATLQALIVYGISLVLSGFIADKFGLQKVMRWGALLFSVTILPLSYFSKDLLFVQGVLTLFVSLFIGPIHSFILLQFPIKARCRGIFISSSIATAIFGGSTPTICLFIFEKYHSLLICSLYPLTLGVIIYALFRKGLGRGQSALSRDYRSSL